ncbi:MAG: hypothetical protein M1832_000672 [Thelocarpon impressellum]|nr:MAG: hypothetical protein M1832_000672 [Thelocarpon impressellum]
MENVYRHLSKKSDEKGRHVKDPTKALAYAANSFVTRTVPNIEGNTRVLAICATTDHEDFASGMKDGWFLSDFYLFNFLMRNVCAAQTWITAEDPANLVKKYGEYLHGNPYGTRSVVLDEKMLKDQVHSPVTVVPAQGLKPAFLDALRRENELSMRNNEPLLLLVFGHGLEETSAVWLAANPDPAEMVRSPESDQHRWLHISEVKAIVASNPKVTLFSTACYSGGWAVTPDLSISALTAAGPAQQSESCCESGSTGRCCGSIFMSAFVEAAKQEAENMSAAEQNVAAVGPAGKSTSDAVKRETAATYADFVGSIHDALVTRVDRFGTGHQIQFSAQEDDWENSASGRSGIPLRTFAERWAQLEMRAPTMDPNASSNRDCSVDAAAVDTAPVDLNSLTAARRSTSTTTLGHLHARFGGFIPSARSMVRQLAMVYLASHPGRPTLPGNGGPSGDCKMLAQNNAATIDWDWNRLEGLFSHLEYRLSAIKAATEFLRQADIPLPDGLECERFDQETYSRSSEVLSKYELWTDLLWEVKRDDAILPKCALSPWRFLKPYEYIAAAIFKLPVAGLDEARPMLERLRAVATRTMEMQSRSLERTGRVHEKKRQWFQSMGKRLRSLSPRKRLSGRDFANSRPTSSRGTQSEWA